MLSLAEYQAYANDIETLGQQTDQQISDAIGQTQEPTKQQATNTAKDFVQPYQKALGSIMNQALFDIATNAVQHYQDQVHVDLPDNIVTDIMRDQYIKRYYGMTLSQRLVLTKLRLNRVITQTAQTGVHNLSGVFSNPIPFGAQTNVSKRLLQGTAIKVEKDVAQKVAAVADYPLIRWTLAKDHVHRCQCEDYAVTVNKDVKEYVAKNNLDIDIRGVYMADDLPDPPHPNCQCEFNLVDHEDEIEPSQSRRPFQTLRRLIRKLLRS